MKIKPLVVSAVTLAVLFNTGQLRAASQIPTVTPEKGHHGQHHGDHKATVNDSAEAELLRQAYDILRTGDHDYQGHRIKAMHRIEAAAKHMGVILRGDDKDKIPQPLSDEKLREARSLLEQVKISGSAKVERRIVWRIEEAIAEINTALNIR